MEREHREEDAAAEAADSNVEWDENAFPLCPPPNDHKDDEKNAWDDTVALVRHCRRMGTKVPIKIPSDLDGKWSKAHKSV